MGFIKRLLANTTLDDRVEYYIYSRTFWVNVACIVADLLALQQFQSLAALRWPAAVPWISLVQGILNLILRYQGGAPLTFHRPVE